MAELVVRYKGRLLCVVHAAGLTTQIAQLTTENTRKSYHLIVSTGNVNVFGFLVTW